MKFLFLLLCLPVFASEWVLDDLISEQATEYDRSFEIDAWVEENGFYPADEEFHEWVYSDTTHRFSYEFHLKYQIPQPCFFRICDVCGRYEKWVRIKPAKNSSKFNQTLLKFNHPKP